jgi:hypothetical protein
VRKTFGLKENGVQQNILNLKVGKNQISGARMIQKV